MSDKEVRTLTLENGSTYTGEVERDLPNGLGRCVWDSGDIAEGQWVDGQQHGCGTYTSSKGWRYEGEFQNNLFHGQGKARYASGNTYEGQWKEGIRVGFGVYRTTDGCTYEGQWERNKQNGFGKWIWTTGSVYEGQWEDNWKHGEGTYTSCEGWVYTGTWVDDQRRGSGKCRYPDGSEYEGEFGDAYKPKGSGIWRYPDGSSFTGIFEDGQRRGEGVFTDADGKKQAGYWEGETLVSKEELDRRAIAWRERLEMKCRALYGDEPDKNKRFAILKEAYWQARNSGFCDSMAWRLASGREDAQTKFWDTACKLKREVEILCELYREELEG